MSYQEIISEINHLTLTERLLLLEALTRSVREELVTTPVSPSKLTASEIRRLPLPERNRILAEAAQAALADYQPGSELVQFTETLAGEDFYEYEEK